MADSTVSTMTAASTLDGTELVYGVQGGADRKVTTAQIKALTRSDVLPVANGGTGTSSPGIVAGTNVTVSGTWPNQTVNSTASGGSFTGGAIANPIQITGGTQTTNNPIIDSTQTWNASGATFTAWKVNVTNTASGGSSLLVDLQVGGSTLFRVDKSGQTKMAQAIYVTNGSPASNDSNAEFCMDTNLGIIAGNAKKIGWAANTNIGSSYAVDAVFTRVAAGIVKLTNNSTGAGVLVTQGVAVASLPAAATAGVGARGFVTDATSPTWGSTVAGGGAVPVPVFSDGTNWKVG